MRGEAERAQGQEIVVAAQVPAEGGKRRARTAVELRDEMGRYRTCPDNAPLWKPGQSGNPTGGSRAEHEIRKLCRELAPSLVAKAVEVIMNTEDDRAALVGVQLLLDRGFGRPKEGDIEPPADKPDLSALSDKELGQLRKLLAKAIIAKTGGGT